MKCLVVLLLLTGGAPTVPVYAPGVQRLPDGDTGKQVPSSAKPQPRRHRPSVASRALRRSPLGNRWTLVARCESGGDWHINSGNGYYGGLQEAQRTWDDFGGRQFAARPDLASKAEQIVVAERILALQGPTAWPVCGRGVL